MQRLPGMESPFSLPRAGVVAALCALALVGCDGGGSESGPGGVSQGEASALDEAAGELDEQQLPNDALPESDLPATEEPSAENARPTDETATETE